MSSILDASVPADRFALGDALSSHPEARFEIVRFVANTSERVMPFLWGSAPDQAALTDSLRCDASTSAVDVVTESDRKYLYRIEWSARVRSLIDVLLDEVAEVLLDACTDQDTWHVRLLFSDGEDVYDARRLCEQLGLDLTVDRVMQLSEPYGGGHFGLTAKQYETIMVAYEAGYYDVPRRINLKDLAEQMGVSHQALSERLRRGHEALIANGLGIDEGERSPLSAVPRRSSGEPSLAAFATGH